MICGVRRRRSMSVKWAGNVEREQKSWIRIHVEWPSKQEERSSGRRSPNTFKLMICLFRFNRHAAAGSGADQREVELNGVNGVG